MKIERLPGAANYVAFGEVTGIHLADASLVDGAFDVTRHRPLARCGYKDYATVSEVFALERPG